MIYIRSEFNYNFQTAILSEMCMMLWNVLLWYVTMQLNQIEIELTTMKGAVSNYAIVIWLTYI